MTVSVASIDSRNEDCDSALRSREFFFGAKYPLLRFKSLRTKRSTDVLLQGEEDLTIRDVTKRVAVPVKFAGSHYVRHVGEMVGFESSPAIKPEDFNVGNSWSPETLGREVTIHLPIGAAAPPFSVSQ